MSAYNAVANVESYDWRAILEAVGMPQQAQGITATSMATTVEDGAFANLEPEAFLNPTNAESMMQEQPFPNQYGAMCVDNWNPYVESGSAQFFGSWKF